MKTPKLNLPTLFLLLLALSRVTFTAQSTDLEAPIDKAIFGSDDRRDIFEAPSRFDGLSTAIANWTSPYFYQTEGNYLNLEFPTMEDHYELCADEKFSNQPTAMISCTGFLVGEDLFMTAGHCMVNVGTAFDEATPMCTDFNWLFDYAFTRKDQTNEELLTGISAGSAVGCEKVLFAVHRGEGHNRQDFALIKLKNKLKGRHIFKIAEEPVKRGMYLHLIGHPSGLPMKYAGGTPLIHTNGQSEFFEAPVDAVGGNSGSPVFNDDNEVVGILVRGNVDFVTDEKNKCDRWNTCNVNGSRCKDGKQEKDYSKGMHVQKFSPALRAYLKKYMTK